MCRCEKDGRGGVCIHVKDNFIVTITDAIIGKIDGLEGALVTVQSFTFPCHYRAAPQPSL